MNYSGDTIAYCYVVFAKRITKQTVPGCCIVGVSTGVTVLVRRRFRRHV